MRAELERIARYPGVVKGYVRTGLTQPGELMVEPAEKRAEQTHQKIAQSATVLKASAVEQADSADRRTELAADRTILAAERTYAAWVRTGLAALASGIGARALLDKIVPDWMTIATGALLILFSAFCFMAAVWRELLPHIAPPRPGGEALAGGHADGRQRLPRTRLDRRARWRARQRLEQPPPPFGTGLLGAISTTMPSSSGKPSVSTWDIIGPIWRDGKLTTAAT